MLDLVQFPWARHMPCHKRVMRNDRIVAARWSALYIRVAAS